MRIVTALFLLLFIFFLFASSRLIFVSVGSVCRIRIEEWREHKTIIFIICCLYCGQSECIAWLSCQTSGTLISAVAHVPSFALSFLYFFLFRFLSVFFLTLLLPFSSSLAHPVVPSFCPFLSSYRFLSTCFSISLTIKLIFARL